MKRTVIQNVVHKVTEAELPTQEGTVKVRILTLIDADAAEPIEYLLPVEQADVIGAELQGQTKPKIDVYGSMPAVLQPDPPR